MLNWKVERKNVDRSTLPETLILSLNFHCIKALCWFLFQISPLCVFGGLVAYTWFEGSQTTKLRLRADLQEKVAMIFDKMKRKGTYWDISGSIGLSAMYTLTHVDTRFGASPPLFQKLLLQACSTEEYERLEILGDSFLDYSVAFYLFLKKPVIPREGTSPRIVALFIYLYIHTNSSLVA